MRRRGDALETAYRQCREMARRTAQNFYYSFLVLPKPKRWSMYALYTFMRRTDDIGDSHHPLEVRKRELLQWREELDRAMAGKSTNGLWWLALTDTVRRHDIPVQRLHDVVDGVASDLETFRYESFAELYQYCYRVASAVGLACIRVWGASDRRAELPAEYCGIAFQLTNVLRDLVEDHDRGRLYLPQEDLRQFGVSEAMLAARQATPEFMELMRFQIARARDYYERSVELSQYLPSSGRAILSVMRGVYGGLLERIAESPERVLDGRVTLSLPDKWRCVIKAFPVRFGGSPAVSGGS